MLSLSAAFPVRQSCSAQYFSLQTSPSHQTDLPVPPHLAQHRSYILHFSSDIANELSEKMFFWMSHRSHAEFILVGFILGFIFADPFIFHPLICLFQFSLLGRVVFGEFLSQNAVHADCSAPCLPFRQSHLCMPVSTPSHTLTLQTALNISEISFLLSTRCTKKQRACVMLPNELTTGYAFLRPSGFEFKLRGTVRPDG